MRLILILIAILSCAVFSPVHAQLLHGHVVENETEEPIPGAKVFWDGEAGGAVTNVNGGFSLAPVPGRERLVIMAEGYHTDTFIPQKADVVLFLMRPKVTQSGEVEIKDQKEGTYISSLETAHTEVITGTELAKAACCDLAGCFETQGTVQAVTTNILTNSKELRILGLSGVYNQVLIEGFPMVQGLSYTYGISAIPGTIVDKIFVAKGANSVLQGFESITGQINVIFKNPANTEPLYLNVYGNSFGETQYNLTAAMPVGKSKKWSTLVAGHMAQPGWRFDRDGDDFLDVTLLRRYSFFNTWMYRDDDSLGLHSKVGVFMVDEERTGGQTNFDPATGKGSAVTYGQNVHYRQPGFFTKTGYRFSNKAYLAGFVSALHHEQESFFGITRYDARQSNLYSNLQGEFIWFDKFLFKTGGSLRYLNQRELVTFVQPDTFRTYDGLHTREEVIPGVFAENNFYFLDNRLTFITGFRADFHNQFGAQFTPRFVTKWDADEFTTVRANAGLGWRTVNVFSENINLLASSREIVFQETLNPERGFNWGISATRKFSTTPVTGSVTLDFFQTRFMNQFFPDYDQNPRYAYLFNFTGLSRSNGFQAEVTTKWFSVLSLKAAYNYLNVFREMHGERHVLPFNPKHRLVVTASLMPVSEKWHIDMNLHWFDRQRLAPTSSNPEPYRMPDFSDPYTLLSAQVTKVWKNFEVYIGCENIFDFRQKRPIIAWQDPFGPYFDTSNVWGPTRGREAYAGIRLYVK